MFSQQINSLLAWNETLASLVKIIDLLCHLNLLPNHLSDPALDQKRGNQSQNMVD